MISDSPKRTLDEITSILTHAKLKQDDFLPTTQVLYIDGKNAKSDQYKLLELDNTLLESLKINDTLVFKGNQDESVVICTENKTYEVRECETSNSLLFVPNLQFSKDLKYINDVNVSNKYVAGINYKYFEANPIKPQLGKILKMLEATKYNGPEKEYEHENSPLMSFEELSDIAAASESELKLLLSKLDAVIINDKVRVLHLDYHFRVLSFLLKSVEENSWPLDEVRRNETINAWKEVVPEEVLEAVFELYTDESKEIDDEVLYKYDEFKVCQFFGRVLLEYAGKFNLNEFLQAWKDAVPEGMRVDEEMLAGVAIIDRKSRPNVIWAFPENNLPNTISERFEILFKMKEKWSVKEITPYIESLTTDKMDSSALLAKYARSSNVDGVRYYCAKHCN